MQTYLVHSRQPIELLRDLGWRGFAGFQLLIGGMLFGSLLHTVFVLSLLVQLCSEGPLGLGPRDLWDIASLAILVAGYGGAIALTITGLRRQNAKILLMLCQFVLPLYWVLHSVAAIRAAWQLVRQPYRWEKTTHGVTRLSRGAATPAGRPALRPRTG
jgi:hypothetical protein